MQRIRFPALRCFYYRQYTTTSQRLTSWSPSPAPPRLPKEEQEIFEQLQKQSTGAFSTPAPSSKPQINQSPHSSSEAVALDAKVEAKGDGEELHPHIRRGAKPEFEGDINPRTGEVGGPKNEPLRWGGVGDWSYNGRVTDF
ncbi:DUF1674-domain-containing protein [Tothia fuscella]|uniref:Succinate dehydrogenase assembly factor 4, mitochondrial n=1 Tax=Tothia fuscella TaxID=1048955 RepID=A0A9P4U0T1_9PEZI|nr:DUF1674-domain-containing protein [Tothia fuscella]